MAINKKVKIRLNTWYWGKYIYEGQSLDGSKITLKSDNFELYDEEKHGWHNSEEYKNGRKEPYNSHVE